MSNPKSCEFPCPYKYSKEIDGVCPGPDIRDRLNALDFCAQVMLGRRAQNELIQKGKVYPRRDPRIVEYRKLDVEDLEGDDLPELRDRDSGVHTPDNPTDVWRSRKKRRNPFSGLN